MNEFLIGKKSFLLNGEEFRVVSGAMHYFRVPRCYWEDRLLKIKACGFNTVETYVAWNLHEPEEGKFDFSDNLDLREYLQLINRLGMYAIVRPGPYICSEWDFGGLPWWLLKYDSIELRCMNDIYLEKVDAFFDKLIPIIADCQLDKGGSVIMVQVENEYGSYGDDLEYMRYIAAGLRKRGITAELFTSDGDCDMMLTGGTVPEIHKTCNFGSRAAKAFDNLRKFQPEGPLMCAEFWNGWFDHWGEKHHKRDASDADKCFDEILKCNGSVSVYMMHGGTNFGFMNGANFQDGVYQPTVTSYDDDAPINEYGGLTPKYHLFKNTLEKYGYKNDVAVSEPEMIKYNSVKLTEYCDLLDNVEKISAVHSTTLPVTMEKLGQGYGYIVYEAFVRGPREVGELHISAADRAYVYINGEFKGIQYRNDKKNKIKIGIPEEGVKLTILVENMGRINYGINLKDPKGLTAPVRLGQQNIYHWTTYCINIDEISQLEFKRDRFKFAKRPVFLKGYFTIDREPLDTFVDMKGFKKGIVIVNGKVLGRYWEEGPQQTLYLPKSFLTKGINEIIVFETEGVKKQLVNFSANHILDK